MAQREGETMAVAEEKRIGGTVVRIHDDCCRDASPKTVEETLRRIAVTAQSALAAKAEHPAV